MASRPDNGIRIREDRQTIFAIHLPEIERICPEKLLDKPVTIYHRNQSFDDFVAEMILLRNELSAIGNNFNQAVKKLHILDNIPEIKSWADLNETSKQEFFKKVDEIKGRINQFYDKFFLE